MTPANVGRIGGRPCAFFDRDGTLTVDHGFTHEPEALDWRPGAREAVRFLNERRWLVIVCTNQSGVAKGFFDEDAVRAFHAAMQDALRADGAFIDAFYYCPFHEDARVEAYRSDHPDRKPRPGMLLRAAREWPIDLSRSFMLGDRGSDVVAGERAGLATSRLVDARPVVVQVEEIVQLLSPADAADPSG